MAPDKQTLRLAWLAWVVICIVWGTTFLGIRIALEGIPPALLGGIRYTVAGVVLAAVLLLRGERLPARANWGGLALLGFLMMVLGNGGVIWAQQWVPSGIAAVVVATTPFWVNGMEAALPGGDRLTRRIALGLVVGFSGILLLVWPELTAGGASGRRFVLGVAVIQVAEIGWAAGSIYSRRHAREENALAAAAMQMLFGGVMMLAIGTVRGEWSLLTFEARAWWAELYLIVAGSLVGYTAYIFALKHLPVSTVSLYAYVNPVIAVLIGVWLANEAFGWRVVVAGALVMAGVSVVRYK
jgi:drug/metabolite transporter (DMT)-like permease